MKKPASFAEILMQAVRDLTEFGFTDIERLNTWLRKLRFAAVGELPTDRQLESQVADALKAAFSRALSKPAILRNQRGIQLFRVEQIKPQLRGELDKRILASVNLIKLNRDQAIEKTLQRFQGWATSIPSGGSRVVDKRDVKEDIGKSMQKIRFEQRRVAIDQGHKLVAAVNEVIALQTGAIAAEWRSHGRHDKRYDARPEHLARDGHIYAIRGNWAMERGLMNKGAGYTDEIERVGELPYCFPGDSEIQFADGVRVAYRRPYTGALSVITTDSGKTLRATPNHPILGEHGWIAIGSLKIGDYVVELVDESVKVAVDEADHESADPTISQVFGALNESFPAAQIGGLSHQFHGDGTEENVDVVRSDGKLSFGAVAALAKGSDKLSLSESYHRAAPLGAFDLFFHADLDTSPRIVRSSSIGAPLLGGSGGSQDPVGVQPGIDASANGKDGLLDDISTNAVFAGECCNGLPGSMTLSEFYAIHGDLPFSVGSLELLDADFVKQRNAAPEDGCNLGKSFSLRAKVSKIAHVDVEDFTGHVYNLETSSGWYITGSLVVHNCRCFYVYLHNLRELPDSMLTERGRFALQEVRVA